jgi:hypothetical protein
LFLQSSEAKLLFGFLMLLLLTTRDHLDAHFVGEEVITSLPANNGTATLMK